MKKFRILYLFFILIMTFNLSACTVLDKGLVKLNLKNNDFDYIQNDKVKKIVIQSTRDSGFRFVITDPSAIGDIYKTLSNGKVRSEKTSLDADYYFEVYIGDEIKTYNYVVSVDEDGVGNFYDENSCYSISKNLDQTILQNLSTIRKPKNFEDIYYNSILEVLKKVQDELTTEDNKVGINISADVDCLKYMFSVDLKKFQEEIDKIIPGAKLINNDSSEYDTVITVKNRGYSTKVFKSAMTVDNKIDKSYNTYYVEGVYEYKNWNIVVSEPNTKPKDW